MKINQLKINGFGKLKNKEIELQDGINIIYGSNESGKSTLIKFISGMFYGISKNKNGKNISDFDKYKPWDDGEFSGKIKYTLENGDSYEVFREFKKKSPVIYNNMNEDITKNFAVSKSKEINFFEQQTGINENLYSNTALISQQEIKLNKADTNNIIQKISNLVSTGDDNISFKKSLDKINKMQLESVGSDRTKNKPINIVNENIRKLEEEKKKLSVFKENEIVGRKNKQQIYEKLQQEKVRKEELLGKKNENNVNTSGIEKKHIILAILFAIISLIVLIFVNNIVIKLISIIPALVMILYILRQRKFNMQKNIENIKNIETKLQKTDDNINDLKVQMHLLDFEKENIDEKLEKLSEIKEELTNEKCIRDELKSLDRSFLLARECLENAYEEIKQNISPKFEQNLCKTISEITNNTYDNVKVSDAEGLYVETENGLYMPVDRLSVGTVDEMYLSLRLSMLEEISSEKMPIMLDETFVYFDEERLKNMICYLQDKNYNNQIVIFTCSEREIQTLNKLKIEYNLINLEK